RSPDWAPAAVAALAVRRRAKRRPGTSEPAPAKMSTRSAGGDETGPSGKRRLTAAGAGDGRAPWSTAGGAAELGAPVTMAGPAGPSTAPTSTVHDPSARRAAATGLLQSADGAAAADSSPVPCNGVVSGQAAMAAPSGRAVVVASITTMVAFPPATTAGSTWKKA